jgi:hypothetical protein
MGPGRSSFDIRSLSNAQIELTMVTQDKPRPGERGQPNEKVLPEAPVNEHPPEEDCKHKKLMRLLRLDRKKHSIAVSEDGVDFGAVFGSPVEGPSMTMDGSILMEDGKEQLTALPQMPGWENGKAMQKTQRYIGQSGNNKDADECDGGQERNEAAAEEVDEVDEVKETEIGR